VSVRDFASRVTSIATLAEPVRRALYLYVVAQPEPVSRDQAATAVGVPRHVAKFNLDKLEEEELLDVEYARPAGRSGPGAGRPAKLYRRSSREVGVSLPERHYDLAAEVMAQAITQADERACPITDALRDAAQEAGHALGMQAKSTSGSRLSRASAVRTVREILASQGYEPRDDGNEMSLANCPFHSLARAHRDLVCGINLNLIASMLAAAGATGLQAELRPSPGQCCVRILRTKSAPER